MNFRNRLVNPAIGLMFFGLLAGCAATHLDEASVELGISEERLFQILGTPDRTVSKTMADGVTFTNHVFLKTNTSVLVDSRHGTVCEIGVVGSTDGFCYPCDYGPSAGTCP